MGFLKETHSKIILKVKNPEVRTVFCLKFAVIRRKNPHKLKKMTQL